MGKSEFFLRIDALACFVRTTESISFLTTALTLLAYGELRGVFVLNGAGLMEALLDRAEAHETQILEACIEDGSLVSAASLDGIPGWLDAVSHRS